MPCQHTGAECIKRPRRPEKQAPSSDRSCIERRPNEGNNARFQPHPASPLPSSPVALTPSPPSLLQCLINWRSRLDSPSGPWEGCGRFFSGLVAHRRGGIDAEALKFFTLFKTLTTELKTDREAFLFCFVIPEFLRYFKFPPERLAPTCSCKILFVRQENCIVFFLC